SNAAAMVQPMQPDQCGGEAKLRPERPAGLHPAAHRYVAHPEHAIPGHPQPSGADRRFFDLQVVPADRHSPAAVAGRVGQFAQYAVVRESKHNAELGGVRRGDAVAAERSAQRAVGAPADVVKAAPTETRDSGYSAAARKFYKGSTSLPPARGMDK